MDFRRLDLNFDLEALRRSRLVGDRAVGDNFLFEERASDARRTQFEEHDPSLTTLRASADAYFKSSVEGLRRAHVPSTFSSVNDLALYRPDIEPNQKLIRLECLDNALDPGAGLDFTRLEEAVRARPRDEAVIDVALERFRTYRGARPAFVAFKSEVDADLRTPDWLPRLRNRLGLGHFAPAAGERKAFALMEYLVADVLDAWNAVRARGAERPFAYPTVLDSKPSAFFFPSPGNVDSSFAVDLTQGAPGRPIREFLHLRITYRPQHLARVGELVGPLPAVKLAAKRDQHLAELRRMSAREDFGANIADEVDD